MIPKPDESQEDVRVPFPARERLIQTIACISLFYSAAYLVWRWGWTLNGEAILFSVALAVAETYGLVTAFFMTFTAWSLRERKPPLPLAKKSVDVFVTVYDEPLNIIRKTALGARGIRYPHRTYLLDDGRRDDVRSLAAELKIHYLRRENNEHAKAGNLNNALAHTKGQFILQLDADHVAQPQMIDRMLGFFKDKQVAFVQSPQDFYNIDAFTYDVNPKAGRIWEDQHLFFRVLQPGKDRVNAAFFVGSCAMLRRRALEDIGGFATKTITEDIETSLLLHSRGWRSVFVNESLAYGLAPASATAFHVQHLRWGQGALQALRKYHVLRMPGLTIGQRLAYLDSLTTYLGGFQRLIFYLAPIAFFCTGYFPVQANAWQFALLFVPHLALQMISFKLLARGYGSIMLADRYAMAKFFTHLLSIFGFLTRRRLRFRVTPKGEGDVPLRTIAPQATLVVITLAAIAWSIVLQRRFDAYEVPGWGLLAYWVNLALALWNAAIAASIIRMSVRLRSKRVDHRFAQSLPVQLEIHHPDGQLAAVSNGKTLNLNAYGAAVTSNLQIPAETLLRVTIFPATGPVQLPGRIVHQLKFDGGHGHAHSYGIAFDNASRAARDAIEQYCSNHATLHEKQKYSESAIMAFKLPQWGQRPRHAVQDQPARPAVQQAAQLTQNTQEKQTIMNNGARIEPARTPEPASAKNLLSVQGSSARLEGKFEIADSIEIECELSGELLVGGTLTIGERGNVTADVHTVDAVISGTYSGNITASGTIEITSTGRVSGNIQSSELVISRGAVFTGNVAKPAAGGEAGVAQPAGRSGKANKEVAPRVPDAVPARS